MSGAVPEAAPQRRCGEPERPRGGCRPLCPRRCREPGRRRGTQARRGAADTGSRRGVELGMKAAAGSRGGSEVPKRVGEPGTGAGGAEGEGAARPLQGAGRSGRGARASAVLGVGRAAARVREPGR